MTARAILAVGIIGSVVAASAAAATAPGLRLQDRSPVEVVGSGFKRGEQVRVTLAGDKSARKVIRTRRRGNFVVIFHGTSALRCDLVRVVAIGAGGSRAVLKLLPSPACAPQRSP